MRVGQTQADCDVWGNAPIHHAAASRGCVVRLRDLLAEDGDVNVPGAWGQRPLTCALWAGARPQVRALQHRQALTTPGPLAEPSRRSLLANVFGIAAQSDYEGHTLRLRGALVPGALACVRAALAQFAAAQGAEDSTHAIVRALGDAAANTWRPTAELQAMWHSGAPLLLPVGSRRHCSMLVLRKPYAILVDRAAARRRPWQAWDVLHAPHGAWPWRMLQDLHRRRAPYAAVALGFHVGRRRAPASDAWRAAFARLHVQRLRTPHCVFANAKAAVLALLALHLQPAQIAQAHAVYKQFTTALRVETLRAYLHDHAVADSAPLDASLVHACLDKLEGPRRSARLSAPMRRCLAQAYAAAVSESTRRTG